MLEVNLSEEILMIYRRNQPGSVFMKCNTGVTYLAYSQGLDD